MVRVKGNFSPRQVILQQEVELEREITMAANNSFVEVEAREEVVASSPDLAEHVPIYHSPPLIRASSPISIRRAIMANARPKPDRVIFGKAECAPRNFVAINRLSWAPPRGKRIHEVDEDEDNENGPSTSQPATKVISLDTTVVNPPPTSITGDTDSPNNGISDKLEEGEVAVTGYQAPPMSPVTLTKPARGLLKLRPYPSIVYQISGGKQRYTYLSSFKESTALHLREFDNGCDKYLFPTRKGIRMKARQVRMLLHYFNDIREVVHEMKPNTRFHLGDLLYASVDNDFGTQVIMQHWYYDEELDQSLPTRRRLAVSLRELEIFITAINEIEKSRVWHDLNADQVPCIQSHIKENQEELAKCEFCTPPGLLNEMF
jgi:hypothetical protein